MNSETQSEQIEPGLCPIDPETGLPVCPLPTEIDCVKVTKVFSECFYPQVDEIEIPFDAPTLEIITADAEEAECVSSETTILDCTALSNDRVRIIFLLEVTSRVPLDEGGYEISSETKVIAKYLFLQKASEEVLDLECQVFPECLFCYITERDDIGNVTQVNCIVRFCILLKTTAEVQLLIPTYGVCQVPECGINTPNCPLSPPLDC